jgi:hypothetical protein
MNAVLTTKTTSDWVEALEAAGVPCGQVYDYAQMFADPQVRHRGLVQYASDPELGEVPHIRTPVRIGEGVRVRHVTPKLGQHNADEMQGHALWAYGDHRRLDCRIARPRSLAAPSRRVAKTDSNRFPRMPEAQPNWRGSVYAKAKAAMEPRHGRAARKTEAPR